MKYVTRAHAKVDRIACPWLIRRFIDKDAEFLFVQADDVMETAKRESALPFDVPGVELGHHGEFCSFDAVIEKHGITDPALLRLAEIVRGADTANRNITPESAGLFAIASGFHALSPLEYKDDHALLQAEFPVYDALYEFCRAEVRKAASV
ncbi:MAG TPA: chromate resistance protein ChrB domain-containing protein [Candidatus Baltobacteraceae bacterium]|nr:chromate resistance protein ChrB domain-containing protein [Candidatus Baltobacteraceae bacterium]